MELLVDAPNFVEITAGAPLPPPVADDYFGKRSTSHVATAAALDEVAAPLAKCASAPMPPMTPGDRAVLPEDEEEGDAMAVEEAPMPSFAAAAAAMEAVAPASAAMPPMPPIVSFAPSPPMKAPIAPAAAPVQRPKPKAAAQKAAAAKKKKKKVLASVPSYMRTTASARKKRRTGGSSFADQNISKPKPMNRAAVGDLKAAAKRARGPVTRSMLGRKRVPRGRGTAPKASMTNKNKRKRDAKPSARAMRATARATRKPKAAVTFGEAVRKMETEVPHRYHSRANNANVGTPQVYKKMSLTKPQPFHPAPIHARPAAKSTAEIEEEFMSAQTGFVAKPVDEKVMMSGKTNGTLGVPYVEPAATTEAKTPYLATKARAALRPSPEAPPAPPAFAAMPIPSGMIAGRGISRVAGVRSASMLTLPSSPAFASRDRAAAAARAAHAAADAAEKAAAAQKVRDAEELRRKKIYDSATRSTAKTRLPANRPTPHQIWEQTHAEEKTSGPFKARAVGEGVPTSAPAKVVAIPLTRPKAFNFVTDARGSAYAESQRKAVELRDAAEERAREFKAMDTGRVKKMLESAASGFVSGIVNSTSAEDGAKALTETRPFNFIAERRIAERAEFNARQKERMCVCVHDLGSRSALCALSRAAARLCRVCRALVPPTSLPPLSRAPRPSLLPWPWQ